MKNRLTNYNFWISMFSAVLLILQALKIEFDIAYVNEIFTAVLGLLVVVGIIIDPTKTATKTTDKEIKTTSIEKDAGETKLPIFQENENRDNDNENDIQIVMRKIVEDLALKIKELEAINKETATKLVEAKMEPTEIVDSHVKEILQNEEEVEVDITNNPQPAAAEMENPYIDFMK